MFLCQAWAWHVARGSLFVIRYLYHVNSTCVPCLDNHTTLNYNCLFLNQPGREPLREPVRELENARCAQKREGEANQSEEAGVPTCVRRQPGDRSTRHAIA